MQQEDAEAPRSDQITGRIIAACIEVHRLIGPGLLESIYEECLCHELSLHGIAFRRQVAIPIEYKGVQLESSYRLDLIVENEVVMELKAADALNSVHLAQLLTYLKLTGYNVGLLVNFNVPVLKQGIRRVTLRF